MSDHPKPTENVRYQLPGSSGYLRSNADGSRSFLTSDRRISLRDQTEQAEGVFRRYSPVAFMYSQDAFVPVKTLSAALCEYAGHGFRSGQQGWESLIMNHNIGSSKCPAGFREWAVKVEVVKPSLHIEDRMLSLRTHERTRWSAIMDISIINSPLGFIGHHAKILIVVTCAKIFWRGFLFFLTLSPLKGYSKPMSLLSFLFSWKQSSSTCRVP